MGSDSNNGTSVGAAFKTIAPTKNVIDNINNSTMTNDISIYILPGEYILTETLKFDNGDSGNSGKNIIYKAYD